jgi:hypothetical protein
LWWDEVPRRLQFNPYIASGYRANLSYAQCACTLFKLHNETGIPAAPQIMRIDMPAEAPQTMRIDVQAFPRVMRMHVPAASHLCRMSCHMTVLCWYRIGAVQFTVTCRAVPDASSAVASEFKGWLIFAGNIWLHFGPSIVLCGKLVWWLLQFDRPHAAAHLRAVVSMLACLLLSSGYHLFLAQVKHYYQWLQADVRVAFISMHGWFTHMICFH